MNRLCVLGALFAVLVGLVGIPRATATRAESPGTRMALFQSAARQSGVPLPVLVALAWEQSGLSDHDGLPSIDHGYGLLDLAVRPGHDTLRHAAALVHRSPLALRQSDRLNLLGGALLLARYERAAVGRFPAEPGAWSPAVVRFTGMRSPFAARLLLHDLFARLRVGVHQNGIALAAVRGATPRLDLVRGLAPALRPRQTTAGADYPGAVWEPASTQNYTDATRPAKHRIRFIVIHDTESSCAAAVNWFANPAAHASAQYIVCEDGTVIQTVHDHDIAWQAGNWPVNQESIGIEHEGYADGAYYTRAQYLASAALVQYLCKKYGISPNRDTIFGHENVPAATHTDPGPNWNWSFYMQRVRGDDTGFTSGSPAVLSATGNAQIYSCARMSCAVLGSANWGEEFAVRGHRSGWERIDYAGQVGWIPDASVSSGSGYVVQSTALVVLRDGPGIKNNAITVVPAGQRYVSVVHDGSWWYVAYNHRYGFLSASVLRVTNCLVGHLSGCVRGGLTLLPNTATPGSTVTVAGTSATPNVAVILTVGGELLATVTADASGNFSARVTIPSDLPTGGQAIVATPASGTPLQATLHVRPAPQFTPQVKLSQPNLSPGQGVTISGKGLPGLTAVTVTVALPLANGKTRTMHIHTFTQPNGTLASVRVTVPAAAIPGTYSLLALAPGAQGQALLTVEGEGGVTLTPTATLTPTSTPSATVPVTGTPTPLPPADTPTPTSTP